MKQNVKTNKFAALDDVGFVGVAKERSVAAARRNTKQMVAYIKRYKEDKGTSAAASVKITTPVKVRASAFSKKRPAAKIK